MSEEVKLEVGMRVERLAIPGGSTPGYCGTIIFFVEDRARVRRDDGLEVEPLLELLRPLPTPPAIDKTKAPSPLPSFLPVGTEFTFGSGNIYRFTEKATRDQSAGCFDGPADRVKVVSPAQAAEDGERLSVYPVGVCWPSFYTALESNPREEPASEPAKPSVPKRADPYEAHRAKLTTRFAGMTGCLLEAAIGIGTAQENAKALAALSPRARRLREQAAKQLDRKLPSEHPRGWPELAFLDAETCDP